MAATGKSCGTARPLCCTWKSTMKRFRKVQDQLTHAPFLLSLFVLLKSRCWGYFMEDLFWLLHVACLSKEHLLMFLWTPLWFCFVYFLLVLLWSQAPICAVTTMETAPSCVYPPPRPQEPACALQDTACAQGSSPVRVRVLTHIALLIQPELDWIHFLYDRCVMQH